MLIRESSENVAMGVDLVGNAEMELKRIFEGVGVISDNIREISNSLSEQSVTLGEINIAVAQLDTVTQNNAAVANSTARISRTLADHSETMLTTVARFRTGTPRQDGWSVRLPEVEAQVA